MQFRLFLPAIFLTMLSSAVFAKDPVVQQEPQDVSGHQTQEWSQLQKELGEKKGKIDQQRKVVEEQLLKSKSETNPMTSEQATELKEDHKKLTTMTNDYNALMQRFEMRFPEKGLTQGRKYFRIDNLTLEQLESRMTVEGREKRLIKKIRTQYNKPESEDVTKRVFDPTKDKKPEVTDPIILVK